MTPLPGKDDLRIALVDKLKWMLAGSGPELRSVDDLCLMLEWLEHAIDALSADPAGLDATLLCALWNGTFEMTVQDGAVQLRLTTRGREVAAAALLNDADMRHFYQSLAGGAAVDEPKDAQ